MLLPGRTQQLAADPGSMSSAGAELLGMEPEACRRVAEMQVSCMLGTVGWHPVLGTELHRSLLKSTHLNADNRMHGYHSPDRKNCRLFWTKLQAICRTNAQLLIQIIRECHV